MTELSKVAAVKDNDGHWFVIPVDLKKDFYELLEDENRENDFIGIFSSYMTGGDLNLVQLYAKIPFKK